MHGMRSTSVYLLFSIVFVGTFWVFQGAPGEGKDKKYPRLKLRLTVEVDSGRADEDLKVRATMTNEGEEPVIYTSSDRVPEYEAFIIERESGDYVDFTQRGWQAFGPVVMGTEQTGGPKEIAPGETVKFEFKFLPYFRIKPGKYRLYLTAKHILAPGPIAFPMRVQESGAFEIHG